jgi:alpha-L-fucosidase
MPTNVLAEHHDGFAMYDSGLSDWTAVKMGPHRDLIGDLAKAVRAEGLHFGVSSHRVEHIFFLGAGRAIPSDVNDPRYAAFHGPAQLVSNRPPTPLSNDFTFVSSAWTGDLLARASELVEKIQSPTLCISTGGSGNPRSARRLHASPPSITTLR